MDKASRLKQANVPKRDESYGRRLPPGQALTDKFPILHEGDVPTYDLEQWSLSVYGEVGSPLEFRFSDLLALPQTTTTSDIHCVTRWSKFSTVWTGVRFVDFMEGLHVHSDAKYVMAYGDHDYSAILPLTDLLHSDVLLAHTYDGAPLTAKHGWPMRLVVPHLYFWKSVKWLRGIEFLRDYRDGYWEARGFHAYGDPFVEQRFSGEALPIPEDEWTKKEFD